MHSVVLMVIISSRSLPEDEDRFEGEILRSRADLHSDGRGGAELRLVLQALP